MGSADRVFLTICLATIGLCALGMVLSVVEGKQAVSETTIAAYCDSLDAIAVKTPDGWQCVTRAVIPADTVRR